MNKFAILGGGFSSVGGVAWFLIGYDGKKVFVAIDDYSTDGIEIKNFTPGQKRLGDGTPFFGENINKIKRFCKTLKPIHTLNWDDKTKASELYWSYKEGKIGT